MALNSHNSAQNRCKMKQLNVTTMYNGGKWYIYGIRLFLIVYLIYTVPYSTVCNTVSVIGNYNYYEEEN